MALQESFSLSGLWTLCWIDGAALREARSPDERRRKILDAFSGQASGPRPPSEVGTFFPVFDAAETSDSIDSAMRELQDHYPGIVGETWFVDHRERGIVSARGDRE